MWRYTQSRIIRLIAIVATLGAVINVSLLPWHTRPRRSSLSLSLDNHENGSQILLMGRPFKIFKTGNNFKRNLKSKEENPLKVLSGALQKIKSMKQKGKETLTKSLLDVFARDLPALDEKSSLLYTPSRGHHRCRYRKSMITEMNNTVTKKPWGKNVDCSKKTYVLSELPQASVIVAFHEHEQLSLVLHTVHSIIQRTPRSLLKEIILIDDNTIKDDFKDILRNYVKAIFDPKVVRVFRSRRPLGLIQARNLGAQLATGDVIVCMDSHMEVQEKWLEALLIEIKENPKTLATSFLDWFEYTNATQSWQYTIGGRDWITFFDWTFAFGFQVGGPIQRNYTGGDKTKAILSPVTVGTIFAIDRKFFLSIGAFDDEMEGWGGENLDLPIRVYLFGGRVVNVPCSNAAHFEGKGYRDYRKGWEPMFYRNYKRVAEVWFDDYKKYLYYYMPEVEKADEGDLTARQDIKRRAIHDIDWYLTNIYPELVIMDRDSLGWGGISNVGTEKCIETYGGYPLSMYPCGIKPNKQNFMWNKNGEMRFSATIINAVKADDTYSPKSEPYMPVSDSKKNSHWIHWKGGPIMDWQTKTCMEAKPSNTLVLTTCDILSPYQQWQFRNYSDSYAHLWEDKTQYTNDLSGEFSEIMTTIIGLLRKKEYETLQKYMFPLEENHTKVHNVTAPAPFARIEINKQYR